MGRIFCLEQLLGKRKGEIEGERRSERHHLGYQFGLFALGEPRKLAPPGENWMSEMGFGVSLSTILNGHLREIFNQRSQVCSQRPN